MTEIIRRQARIALRGELGGKAAAVHTHVATDISDSTTVGRALMTAATAAVATAQLDSFSGGVKGLVPVSGGTGAYLKDNGTWDTPAGGGGGGSGVAVVDFGAFPGASDASVTITGQAGILAGSVVTATVQATATADHSADEHWVETLAVAAGNIVPGTGFTIYARNANTINEPLEQNRGRWSTAIAGGLSQPQGLQIPTAGGRGTLLYGQFSVAWRWS